MRCDNVQLLICEDEFGTKSYYAVNAAGEEFSVSYPVFKALRHADGTRPLRLPEDDVDLLAELENDGLVHTSRLVREESCSRLILFTFGKERVRKVRPGCKVLNAVLPAGAVLTLVAGIAIRVLHVLSDGADMDSFNLLRGRRFHMASRSMKQAFSLKRYSHYACMWRMAGNQAQLKRKRSR